jgi:hypothetical protein
MITRDVLIFLLRIVVDSEIVEKQIMENLQNVLKIIRGSTIRDAIPYEAIILEFSESFDML